MTEEIKMVIIFGMLTAFALGAITVFLAEGRTDVFSKSKKESCNVHFGEKADKQLSNMLNYTGTSEGQEELDDEG